MKQSPMTPPLLTAPRGFPIDLLLFSHIASQITKELVPYGLFFCFLTRK
jgi:hypothetical protein